MPRVHLLELLESRIAPAGLVLMDHNEDTGELILTGDDEANAIDIFQVGPGKYRVEGRDDAVTQTGTSIGEEGNGATTIDRISKITINLGGGNDELDLANLRTLRSLSVNMGSGNDSVDAYNVSSSGAVSFETGGGVDTVELAGSSTAFAGDLTINDSEGGLVFEFGASSTVVRGQVMFTGGSGSDMLTTTSAASLQIGKSLTFNGGPAGTDGINFGNQGVISIGRSSSGQSIVYTGGSGVDALSIGANSVTFKGSVEMNGAGANDLLDIDGVRVRIGQSLAGVSVLLTGGSGSDEIDIQGGSVKAAGTVRLDGGTENDFLDLTNVQAITVGGSIELEGGAGANVFELEAGKLKVGGNVRMQGGEGADRVSIQADGSVAGSLQLLLGGGTSGIHDVEVRGFSGLTNSLKVLGELELDATGSTALDRFRLTNVTIARVCTLTFGDGNSDVDIDNLTVVGALSIATNGGADSVRIERDAVYGESLFSKATTIALGAGDDFLRIGKDSSNNRVSVLGTLTVSGGEGSDSRNDLETANRFGDAADLNASGFEVENSE